MTPTEIHKDILRAQLRDAIRATRRLANQKQHQKITGNSMQAVRGQRILRQLNDQIRMLDVIDAIKEGDPLPFGWQDLRLPK